MVVPAEHEVDAVTLAELAPGVALVGPILPELPRVRVVGALAEGGAVEQDDHPAHRRVGRGSFEGRFQPCVVALEDALDPIGIGRAGVEDEEMHAPESEIEVVDGRRVRFGEGEGVPEEWGVLLVISHGGHEGCSRHHGRCRAEEDVPAPHFREHVAPRTALAGHAGDHVARGHDEVWIEIARHADRPPVVETLRFFIVLSVAEVREPEGCSSGDMCAKGVVFAGYPVFGDTIVVGPAGLQVGQRETVVVVAAPNQT